MRLNGKLKWESILGAHLRQIDADGLHKWHFNAECPVDVRFLKYVWHRQIRMTYHRYFEIFYVHSGSAVFQIQDRCFQVKAGDLVLIGNMTYHRLKECLSSQLKACVLYFLPQLVEQGDARAEAAEYVKPFCVRDAHFPECIRRRTGIPAQVFELMKAMRAELYASSPLARLTVKTYLRMILVRVARYYSDHIGSTQSYELRKNGVGRLRPLFDFLDLNFSNPISVGDAAEILYMSRSHFMRLFKQATGEPFINYLNHMRVARAQVLLASTEKSISQISQEVGFCDQSYFGFLFRRFVGVTPFGWRKSIASKHEMSPARERKSAHGGFVNDPAKRGRIVIVHNLKLKSTRIIP